MNDLYFKRKYGNSVHDVVIFFLSINELPNNARIRKEPHHLDIEILKDLIEYHKERELYDMCAYFHSLLVAMKSAILTMPRTSEVCNMLNSLKNINIPNDDFTENTESF